MVGGAAEGGRQCGEEARGRAARQKIRWGKPLAQAFAMGIVRPGSGAGSRWSARCGRREPRQDAAMRSRTPRRGLREALAGGPGARTGSRCKSRAQVARRAGTAGSAGAPGTAGGWRSRGVLRYRGLASGRDGLDGDHLPAAASRAAAQRLAGQGLAAVAVVAGRLRLGLRLGHGEQAAAQHQLAPPVAVGEEAEMPDAVEAGRQEVEQEAPDELGGGQRHRLEAVRLAVVLEAEAHAPAVEGQEALVGDGDAVRVAAEVVEHAGGPVEGRLGVDHPLAAAQGPQVAREGGRVGKVGEAAAEPQAAPAEGLLELVEEERAEAAGEDAPCRRSHYFAKLGSHYFGGEKGGIVGLFVICYRRTKRGQFGVDTPGRGKGPFSGRSAPFEGPSCYPDCFGGRK